MPWPPHDAEVRLWFRRYVHLYLTALRKHTAEIPAWVQDENRCKAFFIPLGRRQAMPDLPEWRGADIGQYMVISYIDLRVSSNESRDPRLNSA